MVTWKLLALLLCQVGFSNGMHETKSSQKDKVDVKVNVPNFLNLIPNFNELLRDLNADNQPSELSADPHSKKPEAKKPLTPYFQKVRENYKVVREALESALNRSLNDPNAFSLNLKRSGSKTKLDVESPFGQLSIKTKFQTKEQEEAPEATTEVPFDEYLGDLVQKSPSLMKADPSTNAADEQFARRALEDNQMDSRDQWSSDPEEQYTEPPYLEDDPESTEASIEETDFLRQHLPENNMGLLYGQPDEPTSDGYYESRTGESFNTDEDANAEESEVEMYHRIMGSEQLNYEGAAGSDEIRYVEGDYVPQYAPEGGNIMHSVEGAYAPQYVPESAYAPQYGSDGGNVMHSVEGTYASQYAPESAYAPQYTSDGGNVMHSVEGAYAPQYVSDGNVMHSVEGAYAPQYVSDGSNVMHTVQDAYAQYTPDFTGRSGAISGDEEYAQYVQDSASSNGMYSIDEGQYAPQRSQPVSAPAYSRSDYMMDLLTSPMHRTTHRHQNMYNEVMFPQAESNMGNYEYAVEGTESPSQDDESFDEYIDDIEAAAGKLTPDVKDQLRRAFRDFKYSLDQIDLGHNFDLNKFLGGEPQDAGRRIIDQRDLEIAFLNIDAETNMKKDPSKKTVVAFTLTGIPLKLYIDQDLENPIEYLHQVLSEAGVTLNIPVHSDGLLPAGEKVLYVGAGNKGESVTTALTLEVPDVKDIKRYTKRFRTAKHASTLAVESDAEALKEALHKTLTSPEEVKFSDVLEESFKSNPDKVLEDISTFFTQAPDVMEPSEDDDDVLVEAEG